MTAEKPLLLNPQGDISYWRDLFASYKKSLGGRSIKKKLAEADDFFQTRTGQNDIQKVLLDRASLETTRKVVLTLHRLDPNTQPALGPRLVEEKPRDVIRIGEPKVSAEPEEIETPDEITLETLHESLAAIQLKQILLEKDLERVQYYLRQILERMEFRK
ncbi:hypothetical protein [Tellurirhabdus rosea]|uniref:hypothetical protein n=1 Tax=Tellurirhabdus rosea TaxID=2674997 RepID=UPI0022585CE5|nr:hypothetical protein [Tellurirhabdus rosea]